MLPKSKIDRINALAKKAKKDGLTIEESNEQKALRKEYLQTFRQSFTSDLHSLKFVDPNGDDVTPEKLKQSKNQSGMKH
ncbi:DUF896 domain-containing protein [Fictibacillus aquaticus]|uniref:UPF0291 protein CGZ90_02345 n=1 Tax=Fictibacillus aquaticus TaxID=2021314 RepID=A0A235FBV4_9BACL|nr:DUF896 domain-containing protein [Fictibacillus aquaticus]OYD58761.1 hypothetical protein CGZ90_02345 [Fictibacillus aquaticus]